MFFNENKIKHLHTGNSGNSIPGGLGRDTNMATVSLFRGTNVAAVMSCENQECTS